MLDDSNPPFYRWFSGGKVNTCYNALDRHIEDGRGDQPALIYDSQPIMDYFRKVNDDVVIGLGDIKGKPLDFFFHLTRDQ